MERRRTEEERRGVGGGGGMVIIFASSTSAMPGSPGVPRTRGNWVVFTSLTGQSQGGRTVNGSRSSSIVSEIVMT